MITRLKLGTKKRDRIPTPHPLAGDIKMKNFTKFIYSDEPVNDFVSLKIVGRFWIKNRQYLVVAIEHEWDDSAPLEKTHQRSSSTLAIGQFEVDGQRCVVIEADSHFATTQSDAISRLTERELQIVRLVASGCPNKQIAKRLHISEWTVSTHLRRVFAKLGVESRAAMVYQCASLLNH